ncbi:MAG: transposase [Synechococcales cyanobacterium]
MNESAAHIARWVKRRASRILREEFPALKKLPSFWSPRYFVATTGQVSSDTVQKYIEGQRGELRSRDTGS